MCVCVCGFLYNCLFFRVFFSSRFCLRCCVGDRVYIIHSRRRVRPTRTRYSVQRCDGPSHCSDAECHGFPASHRVPGLLLVGFPGDGDSRANIIFTRVPVDHNTYYYT